MSAACEHLYRLHQVKWHEQSLQRSSAPTLTPDRIVLANDNRADTTMVSARKQGQPESGLNALTHVECVISTIAIIFGCKHLNLTIAVKHPRLSVCHCQVLGNCSVDQMHKWPYNVNESMLTVI